MSRSKTYQNTLSFLYDFPSDGGAVGNIPMGVFLNPTKSIFMSGAVVILDTFTSGGAATLSVGFTAPGSEQFLLVNQALPTLVAGNAIALTTPAGAPQQFSADQIQFSINIGTAPFTGGVAIFYVNFQMLP